MDKQSLGKHHFWILLALAVVLIPVVLGGAVFGVRGAANDKQKAIDSKLADLKKASPKTSDFIAELERQKNVLSGRRDVVWKKAYEDQAGLIAWPPALSHLDSYYYGDPIQQHDLTRLKSKDVYLASFEKLPELIEPTRFAGNSWKAVLRFVPNWEKQPSTEDAWLAMEDLNVQREVLKDIQAINMLLARCLVWPTAPAPLPPLAETATDPEKAEYADEKSKYETAKKQYEAEKVKVAQELKDKLKPQEGEKYGRFMSPYWQLDLAVSRSRTGKAGEHVFRGYIKNVSNRRQNIAKIAFKVFFQDPEKNPLAQPAKLEIQHEYLAAGAEHAFKDITSTFSAADLTIRAVEQILDSRFVPVKRVDRIVLCYPSHRYANQPLVTHSVSAPKEGDAAPAAAPTTPTTPFGGGPVGSPDDMRGGVPGAMATNPNSSTNGLLRPRYLHVTRQVRRMPIGLVLIVDQAHVQDVERAFANSRLRWQNTQFEWRRFRGSLGFADNLAPGTPGAIMPDPTQRGPGSDDGERRGPPVIRGGRGPSGSDGPTGSPDNPGPAFGRGQPVIGTIQNETGPVEEGTANLVELSVYGVASIYERYPPRETQPGTTSGEGAAPPAPAAGTTVPAPAGTASPATPTPTPAAPATGETPPATPPAPATNPPPPAPPPAPGAPKAPPGTPME